MKAAATVLLISLAACDALGPDIHVVNQRRLAPVPPEYATWYREAEACLGRTGNFRAVHWFVADSIGYQGTWRTGAWMSPHEIVVMSTYQFDPATVRHESVHDITHGDLPHDVGGGRFECEHPPSVRPD